MTGDSALRIIATNETADIGSVMQDVGRRARAAARKVALSGLELRYVASGSTAPNEPLEQVNISGRSGVPAIQIWQEDVAPAFGLA